MRFRLAALLLLAGCASAPSGDLRIPAATAVWRLSYESGAGGSGVPVASWRDEDGWHLALLTAKHVVEGEETTLTASRGEEKLEEGEVLSLHASLDLALVVFSAEDRSQVVPLSREKVRAGDRLLLSGWQGMRFLWLSEGVACSADRTSAPNWLGGSGGAVLDQEGRLVGIATNLGISSVPFSPFSVLVPHQCYFAPSTSFAEWVRSTLR